MWRNKSIAKSLRNWMIALAVVPLMIMAIQGYHCARQAVLELKTAHLRTVVEAKQIRIEDWLTQRQHELAMLASSTMLQATGPTATEPDRECLRACFTQTLVNNPQYESIVLYSGDWTRLADTGPSEHSDDKLLPESVREAFNSGENAVISQPHIHEDGMIGIHIGMSTAGMSNSDPEYIVAVLNLSDAVYPILLTEIDRTDAIHSYFVTGDGFRLDPNMEGIQRMHEDMVLPRATKVTGHHAHPSVYLNAQGEQVVGVSLPIPELDWVLVSEARTTDAFAWLGHLRMRAIATGIISLALVVVLASQLSKRISLPLRHMAEVAHTISSGQSHTRMEHFPGQEHVEVADAFNRMLDELERTQAKLAHAAALSAIGELSASIVHEMRNPLSAIKMNLEVLKHTVENDPMHRELAEIATEQTKRLETMLSDLLQYGKKVEIDKAEVPVDEFVQEIKTCIRREEGKNVGFTFRNECNAAALHVDREHMLRAVSNLVDNAVQASPDGGTVTLTLRRDEQDAQALVIEVSDTGPGISERVAEKLFEPFFTTRKKGTGLGLANVKKIAELHGGRILFRNNDPGAVFSIVLPENGELA